MNILSLAISNIPCLGLANLSCNLLFCPPPPSLPLSPLPFPPSLPPAALEQQILNKNLVSKNNLSEHQFFKFTRRGPQVKNNSFFDLSWLPLLSNPLGTKLAWIRPLSLSLCEPVTVLTPSVVSKPHVVAKS